MIIFNLNCFEFFSRITWFFFKIQTTFKNFLKNIYSYMIVKDFIWHYIACCKLNCCSHWVHIYMLIQSFWMLKCFHTNLDPYGQTPTDFIKENVFFIQQHTALYSCCHFSTISRLILEQYLAHFPSKPQFDNITSELNMLCSTCKNFLLYCFYFLFSFTL